MRAVAVVGSLTSDVVDGRPPRPGGAPFYAAGALRLLGRPALIVTRCAESDRPALLPRLVAQGVPVEWVPSSATFRYRLDYRGEERSLVVEEAPGPWQPGPWLELLHGVRWIHVGALARGEFPPAVLAVLARGRLLSYDAQGLVRPEATGPVTLAGAPDAEVLRHVAILKLAEEEARVLVGGTDRAALASLGVREVVVTRGERGSLVLADGEVEDVPALPVRTADPTGAGDAFAVAYLVSRGAGLRPAASARRATAVVAELLVRRTR
ncbi:MAG TPA: PfkB family carbohydrate kinase [Gaiellaceae bacterium]|nr:PfkB family carbohydrate kinase [Gaiellaceae bacterium]